MSDVKAAYGTNGQALTISLASLADSSVAGRESTVVDNSSNKFLDALVSGKIKIANSGGIAAPSAVFVYAYGSVDGGTEYGDTVTGSDAAITLTNPPNLKLLGLIYTPAINATYKGGPWSIASLFGGRLPEKWGIVVVNDSGTSLSATGSDHAFKYQGVYATVL